MCEPIPVYIKVKDEIDQLLVLRCVDKREMVVSRQRYTSYRVHRGTCSQGPRVGVPTQLQSSPDTL